MEKDQPTEDENQHPLLNQIQESTLYEEIAAAQREDDSCQQDKARLQRLAREKPADERRIKEEYALVDDCIWKRTPQQLLLYVPRTLRRQLLEEYHDGPHAAHPGRDEIQTAIQQKFWWPKLPRNVAECVRCCTICAAVKAGPPQAKAPLPNACVAAKQYAAPEQR
ncbi:uncharacterized protein LOC108914177 [Anoplophora glabripennis]|uniref:uncharacterized protein LOC108914177 n=1 Tax=Anoplophora glabripennis TaxID=217634 RepID=UPI000873C922|nr:uncharacterized protein LOC108914177 [Anoplophora glabripennis]